jgi:DNA repair protein RecO (recombination protein O)
VRGIETEALILRSVDFGESDRILHLLTPDSGRLTTIAKGARRSVRRFGGTLDLFNHLLVQVDFGRKTSMARLDQARLIGSFEPLRIDPGRFALGCYLLELFDRLAPDGGNRADMRRLFDFAIDALETIAAWKPSLRLRTLLELRALDALGLRPELRNCVRCGEPVGSTAEVDFHVGDGGTVCAACAIRMEGGLLRVHLGTLRALEQGLRLDFDRLDRLGIGGQSLEEAQQLISRFQRFHVGVELRSERFLDRILQQPRASGL